MSVDLLSGEVEGKAPVTPLERERTRREALELDLQLAEEDLQKMRRQLAAARAETTKQANATGRSQIANTIWRYYLQRTGKNPDRCRFGEKRYKAVLARLAEDRTAAYICRAIDGLAECAYVNPDSGKRYDDIELVCRNEIQLEKYHEDAELHDAKTLLGAAWLAELEHSPTNPNNSLSGAHSE